MHCVDVVVRTLADARRADGLFRALDSIQDQRGVAARPVVIVNGGQSDPATVAALQRRPGIVLGRVEQASLRLARAAGRDLVSAPFFAYLDDDDELVADSLQAPLAWLGDHADCDVVVSTGHFVGRDGALSGFTRIADHLTGKPALGLLEDGWLVPGAFVCRTQTIPADMLRGPWDNMEWTHLAFELCARRKRLHFMDVPTMRYHDTPGSLSKRVRHQEAQRELMAMVRRDPRLDAEVRRAAHRKYVRTLHDLSMKYWAHGQYRRAWRCHLGSLRPPYTFKYMLYSRKLLWPSGARDGDGSS